MPAVATAGGLPTRLGKYEILTPLAAGGMARIYIARTTGIGSFERHVVLKLITPERANDTTAVQMFLDEARLAASLNHQNVAQVFEVGEDQGIHYLAMEYVHGQDLRALLAKAGSQGTRVPLELALTVVAGAASGLGHAHERRGPDGVPLGIVHRDVSPSNIMIGYDGSVKLLDFGIAKATARSVETQSGIIKGKFAYMAPEQCRGRDVDQRSDVFSLGIILYEVTTQHRCFRADSDFDTMHRIVTGDVVRPTRLVQGYPQALEAIVMKALAVDINQRYQSATALLEAIESFSVASRMSLSTMSLGRFMRDMFGEQPEPWLSGRHSQPFLQPPQREATISNTNGSGEAARATTPVPLASQPEKVDSDSVVDVGSSVVESIEGDEEDSNPNMQTILDMPKDLPTTEAAEQDQPEWNAKAYRDLTSTPTPINADIAALVAATKSDTVTVTPGDSPASAPRSLPTLAMPSPRAPTAPPVRASTPPPIPRETVPREPFTAPTTGVTTPGLVASSSDAVDVMRTQPSMPPADAIAAMQPAVALQTAAAMQPQSAPLSHALAHPFATPGSGSGPAHPALAVPPNGSIPGAPGYDHGYPRYEGPEPSSELRLQPNRRPLIIGAIIIGFGLLIILAVSLGGGETKPVARGVDDTSETPGSAEAGSAKAMEPTEERPEVAPVVAMDAMVAEPPADAAVAVIEDESIHIKIDSDPQGANVMLAGKIIGTTPLDTQVPRQATTAYLVVSRAEYLPEQKEIDLRSDYDDKLVLKKAEPAKQELPKTPKQDPSVQKPPPKKDPVVRKDPPKKDPPKKDPPKPPVPRIKCVKAGTQNPFEPQMCDGKPCPICK